MMLIISRTHKSSWIGGVCSHFSINLDQSLLHNTLNLISSEGILKTVSQKHNERDTLSLLVWTRGGLWCLYKTSLVKSLHISATPRGLHISQRVCQASNALGRLASSSASSAPLPEKERKNER